MTMALAAAAAGSADPAAISRRSVRVTIGGRTCSNPADCLALLAANEDIDFDGATGGIAIDENGDVTTARITTLRVSEATLQEIASEDVDLVALAQQDVYASALFTAQVQQTLRLLGLYAGEVTGVWDQATTDAVLALQRQLGDPRDRCSGTRRPMPRSAARYGDLVGGLSTSVDVAADQTDRARPVRRSDRRAVERELSEVGAGAAAPARRAGDGRRSTWRHCAPSTPPPHRSLCRRRVATTPHHRPPPTATSDRPRPPTERAARAGPDDPGDRAAGHPARRARGRGQRSRSSSACWRSIDYTELDRTGMYTGVRAHR